MKNFKIYLVLISVCSSLILWNCYYDNEEVLYTSVEKENCDTVNITYSGHIAKTLSTYCYSCHGNTYKQTGNGIQLNSYKSVADNINKIIRAINHDPDYSAMPKNANKLSDCKINQFVIWKKEGSPNN